MSKPTIHIAQCFHCGENIDGEALMKDNHQFCCSGCKGAYLLLNENALCEYYELESRPGNTIKNDDYADYSYLDKDAIANKLIDFKDEQLTKVRLRLPQIHCASCIWLLENLGQLNEGIIHSRVNFAKKEIIIDFEHGKTSLREVVELLVGFGYIPEINLGTESKQKSSSLDKTLYYKLGVAGFAFGNIMLMSFPEYLGISGEFKNEFTTLFRILNVVLSIPVLFYSASDYLQNAFTAIRTKIINLDVPIVMGMFALFGRSLYEVITGLGSGYFDSLVGFTFFLLLGKLFQAKTYNHLSFERDFKSFFPLAIHKKSDEGFDGTPIRELKVADIILVKHGQIIPADSILLSDLAQVDYSFVTGESVPVKKRMGDYIYAGGKLVGTTVELLVDKKVEESYLTELWRKDEKSKSHKLSQFADGVGKYFTYAVLAIAAVTFAYWSFESISKAFLVFTSVLIVACPCALALSIPFTQGTAMRWLAKAGFFLRDSSLLDRLSSINDIFFDKTGTLTENNKGRVDFEGKDISQHELAIASVLFQSAHPLAGHVYEHLGYSSKKLLVVSDFKETEASGIEGRVDGRFYKLGKRNFVCGAPAESSSTAEIHLSINNKYQGKFLVRQKYREGLDKLANGLNEYNKFLLSGDHDHEKKYLQKSFGKDSSMFFNQSPFDKQEKVRILRSQGRKVAMVGDGLNDAGALVESDFGISITDDVNNFTPASHGILKGSLLAKLPAIFKYAKTSKRIIYAAFAISFLYNLLGLSFAVQGLLSPVHSAILMPLSSITVVLFTTGMSSLYAKKYDLA